MNGTKAKQLRKDAKAQAKLQDLPEKAYYEAKHPLTDQPTKTIKLEPRSQRAIYKLLKSIYKSS